MRSPALFGPGFVLSSPGAALASMLTLRGAGIDAGYDSGAPDAADGPTLAEFTPCFTPHAVATQSLNRAGAAATGIVLTGMQIVAHAGFAASGLKSAAQGAYQRSGAESARSARATATVCDAARPLSTGRLGLVLQTMRAHTVRDETTHARSAFTSLASVDPRASDYAPA